MKTHVFNAVVLGIAALHAQADDGIPAPFLDEAIQRGVVYHVAQGDFDGPHSFGCGVALVDLDNDGDPDLVTTGAGGVGAVALFVNNGMGYFTKNEHSGLLSTSAASGVVAGDYDGDGLLDLFFTCWNKRDRLYRNEGGLRFVDVSDRSGLVESAGAGTGAAWADYDGDGDLDLYVCNRTGSLGNWLRNQLWRQDEDNTFTDVAAELGVDDEGASFQPIWFDYDNDNDLDLYISTDKGFPGLYSNKLFRNDGGTFLEQPESGAQVTIDAMGVCVGDINHDGLLDIYCTNIGSGNPLLINQGNGMFIDMAEEADVGSFATGWGAAFLDLDNDRDLDLYVCNMTDGLNRLYQNHGEFPMEDVAAVCNVSCYGDSYALATADIDNDGDLDMVVQNFDELIRVYINFEDSERNWIKFNVRGAGLNCFAVGARLSGTTSDGTMLIREIRAGSNYKSSEDFVQHFGLGEESELVSLALRFPDGAERSFAKAPAAATWQLLHPTLLGDIDEDGTVDPHDLAGYPGAHNEIPFVNGWEVLDFTGDFFIDDDDVEAFLKVYDGPIIDCNDNDTIDAIEIARGDALDENRDGLIDGCVGLPGDVNGDGAIDGEDLTLLLGHWGQVWPPGDLNNDGQIDGADLLLVLSNWSR